VLYWLRGRGWAGKAIWIPIPLLVFAAHAARTLAALARGRRPATFALWKLLRPRQHDATLVARLLSRMRAESVEMVDERVPVAL
jgi:hypothetical protein